MTEAGTNCPRCEQPLSLWTIVRAPLPSQVRCRGCRARLRFDANLTLIAAVAVVALSGIAYGLLQLFQVQLAGFGVVTVAVASAAVALAAWLLFEVALASYLLSRRRVSVRA